MYTLKISPMVYDDLAAIKAYITNDLMNPEAALDLIRFITNAIRTLPDFPHKGTPLSSLLSIKIEYRFIICKNYLVFYRVEQSSIFVLRVLYKRRNYLSLLFKD
ncbi:addiction module RelE/StbE family toxin [Sporomusaceae bacterium BoRhaA]|uniref:type II toxin-antitoxin system RelE/ParE family toxin n=1 Tax=Pelorhabdus rhamnosifermentans TaxID=2772457 RepID=UPI001C06352B|nr:type II toxin-antitoxin system RelE/ParE family toxin [Pelorhabdus rhamnosifermentans]MBU2700544.1 addiction module RelE/StbE family toxin [Pelorhabdus rhamnosifermentans]